MKVKNCLVLIPLMLLLMVSCTTYKFGFSDNVEAQVMGTINRYIGIKYEIQGIAIFHDVYMETVAQMEYFKNMKTIPLTVKISCNDFDTAAKIEIELFYKDSKFGTDKRTYAEHDLPNLVQQFAAKDMEIPSFKWYMYNEVEYDDGITPQDLRKKLAEKEGGDKEPEVKVSKNNETKPEKSGGSSL